MLDGAEGLHLLVQSSVHLHPNYAATPGYQPLLDAPKYWFTVEGMDLNLQVQEVAEVPADMERIASLDGKGAGQEGSQCRLDVVVDHDHVALLGWHQVAEPCVGKRRGLKRAERT